MYVSTDTTYSVQLLQTILIMFDYLIYIIYTQALRRYHTCGATIILLYYKH